jgi:radical SAM protein with 4Fe4S-binding SPASM domain
MRSVRLHLLEVEDGAVRDGFALSPKENVEALRNFVELESELESIEFDVVGELEQLLLGDDSQVSCVWRACDPYTTEAVRGVEGNGQSSNCGRTNKDGVDFTKATEHGFERGVALYETPQEHGGCQGCRFFLMCKGQCPGTAIDGDWRNRTEHCGVWMTLFTHVERKLLTRGETPLTLSTARKGLERRLVAEWRSGRNPQLASLRPKDADASRQAQSAPRPAPAGGAHYLAHSMHAFRRCSWVSDAARALWQERVHRIEKSLATLAILGVADGLRPCAMIEARPEQSFALGQLAAAHDLAVAVLQRGQGRRLQPPQPGMPASAPLPEGVPALDVLVVGTARQVGDLHRLHRQGLFDELEEMLGYPSESRAFAHRVYDEMGLRDPIWPMAQATPAAPDGDRSDAIMLEVPCAPHSNFLLASIGLAPTPFQPTSFDCPHAALFFDGLMALGRDRGFAPEMDWLTEILSWPMQWSALHGIAETKTPVLKISSDTDATANKLTLTYLGTAEVALAAQGLGFPYLSARARPAKVVNG